MRRFIKGLLAILIGTTGALAGPIISVRYFAPDPLPQCGLWVLPAMFNGFLFGALSGGVLAAALGLVDWSKNPRRPSDSTLFND